VNQHAARSKADVLQRLRAAGIVAVVRVDRASDAIAIARALWDGGISAVEITYTTPDAGAIIAQLAVDRPSDGLVAAGTLLAEAQAKEAADAGADFLVSASFVAGVAAVARERNIALIPGALTPGEIHDAWANGGDIVKVFPASRFGPRYFEELRPVFPQIPLLASAGVSLDNVDEWFRAGAVAVAIGSSVIDRDAVASGEWDVITHRAREFVASVKAAREQP
jgi:2-dehydro-3-deoxyphosphogluconate aldolase / (4S)-4-hydroxy-2-oxoglutarate aldolase